MARVKPDSEYKVIQPDGSVAYQKRVWTARDPLTGKRKQVTVKAPTLAKFRQAIADAQRARPLSELTLADYLLTHWLPAKEAGARCRASSLVRYERIVRRAIIPTLGTHRLDRLEPLHIQAWLRELGTRYAPNTVKQALATLSSALAQAVTWRLIGHNPCAGIQAPRVRLAGRQVWSEAELERFLASTVTDGELHPVWCVLGRTGMRVGEVRALYWSDLDLEAGVVRVRRTMTVDRDGKEIVGELPKTDASVRDVSLDAETVRVLRGVPRRELRVFPFGYKLIKGRLAAACKAMKWEPITPHDFRHTHETHMLRSGVHPRVAMARLGHRSLAMLAHYSHPDLADQEQAVEAMYGGVVRRLERDVVG